MVGHAAKGGLKYYLIKNLWATELTADEHMKCELLSNSLYTLFTIDIKLTGFGFKHLDKVSFSFICNRERDIPMFDLSFMMNLLNFHVF